MSAYNAQSARESKRAAKAAAKAGTHHASPAGGSGESTAEVPATSLAGRLATWMREPVSVPKPSRVAEWLREPVGGRKQGRDATTAAADAPALQSDAAATEAGPTPMAAADVAGLLYGGMPPVAEAVPTLAEAHSPVVRASNVERRYTLGRDNEVAALRGASVEIGRGEMVAIVGPSGSGKSTLMHIVGCLDTPDGGEVYINGRRVDDLSGRALTKVRSTEIGFIFQGFNLIPTLNAMDNVALAAEYAGVPRREALARADALLDLVGLGERTMHSPSELSGGQQQRVAIARALVNRPALVLGDEPTGDLDTATSDEIVGVMRRINRETGTTFVLVTHNPEVAAACDRTISMRDGSVEDHGFVREPDEAATAGPAPGDLPGRADTPRVPVRWTGLPAVAPACC
jgi:putative ABC transport system ATP-binding protein